MYWSVGVNNFRVINFYDKWHKMIMIKLIPEKNLERAVSEYTRACSILGLTFEVLNDGQ